MNTPKAVIELAKKSAAKIVDIKFVDTFGTWQPFSCPIRELTEEIFSDGLGFDGSSIRGWKSIEASDMLALPDPATAFIDPMELKAVPNVAGSLGEALDCLQKDHDFLLKGDVFTEDFLEMWISAKR